MHKLAIYESLRTWAEDDPALDDLAKSLDPKAPEQEKLPFTAVGGKTIDENSPVLLIGDSHTLVFSTGGDMLAAAGGLAEHLALP